MCEVGRGPRFRVLRKEVEVLRVCVCVRMCVCVRVGISKCVYTYIYVCIYSVGTLIASPDYTSVNVDSLRQTDGELLTNLPSSFSLFILTPTGPFFKAPGLGFVSDSPI